MFTYEVCCAYALLCWSDVCVCRPRYVVGIVEVVEEEDNGSSSNVQTAQQQAQAQLQQLLLQLLLVCALYAQQDVLNSPAVDKCSSSSSTSATGVSKHQPLGNKNSSSSSSSSGGQLPTDVESFCSSIVLQGLELSAPWSSQACQQHCQQILVQLASTAAAATQVEAPEYSRITQQQQGVAGSLPQKQQQQGRWQQLLGLLLPQLLDSLRDTLMAQHRHNRAQDKGELGG
jgi:hypothetical protein